ncbi:response regulator [uncultured Draconibacterium sp.]|uniref:response regulator n=1 Tax=uncultured Draconibacterium sp. TaxID=1573823 RepID=UPI002AA91260|nr:response regulator [uncultured Draconibacterium sp.]
MDFPKNQIVIIDDNRKETDPLLVQLKLHFKDYEVVLRNKAKDGLDYILKSLDKKTIVLLDYDLGRNEPNGTEILNDIRKRTSLVYVIMVTANNLDNIPREDLVEYINKDAFAFVSRTVSYKRVKPLIERAMHFLDARVDSILEQWINRHSEDELNKPYLQTSAGEKYSLKDILSEIRLQSAFGKEMERSILMLAIDLLTRNKRQIDD